MNCFSHPAVQAGWGKSCYYPFRYQDSDTCDAYSKVNVYAETCWYPGFSFSWESLFPRLFTASEVLFLITAGCLVMQSPALLAVLAVAALPDGQNRQSDGSDAHSGAAHPQEDVIAVAGADGRTVSCPPSIQSDILGDG